MKNYQSNYYRVEMQKINNRKEKLFKWGLKEAEHFPCGKIKLKELAK